MTVHETSVHDDVARQYRQAGWWRDETVLDDLRRAAAAQPGKPAVICWHADGRPADSVTYAELARRAERAAGALLSLGVRRGDVVTLQLPNSWELITMCLACARIGAIAGPVIPIMRRREVEFMTRLTASPVYVGAAEYRGFSYAQMSAEVAAAVPTLRHRVLVGAAAAGITTALDFERDVLGPDWAAQYPPAHLDALEAGADDPAQVMFTSGTTGEPKGVLHSHNTLHAMNRAQADVLRLQPGEVTAMGSPTTHQAGYTWNFIMPLLLGATAVQIDAWDPGLMLRAIEAEGVTFFMGAPTFLADLIAAQQDAGRDLSGLAVFATGSAPVAPVLVERAREVLGCRVYALWGMTENGCVTVTRPEDPELRAAESDGTPVPGMEVRIVDAATRQPAAPGATGLLEARGASQCLGYYRRPEIYRACLSEGGWFDTGDLARADGYGGIRIMGRAKEIIVRGGENIPVTEVEAALLRHPRVREVAVVGYPDERLGERACAVLVPDGPAPSLDDLKAHLDGLAMAKPYWPERVKIVESLPRTPSGKVQKFVLRDELQASSEKESASMDFDLTAGQRALRDQVREFAGQRIAPWYEENDRSGTYPPDLVKEMAGQGLFGLRIAPEFQGQGRDAVSTGVVLEELARADLSVCYPVLNAALIGGVLTANGTADQRARWLPPIARGEAIVALCLTEPEHGTDAARIELRARPGQDGWLLSGRKTSIMAGMYATHGLVFARTGAAGARGVTAFYLSLDPERVTRTRLTDLGCRSGGRAVLDFDDLRAGPEDVVGGEGLGFVQVMRGFDYSRALISLMATGAATASLDAAFEHAATRQAFGQAIGRFQAVAFPLVEQATYLHAARLLAYEALALNDAGKSHRVEANMAKWWAPKAAMEAAHQALLTLGHLGWSDGAHVAQRLRDVIGLQLADGTANATKLVVARELLGRENAP